MKIEQVVGAVASLVFSPQHSTQKLDKRPEAEVFSINTREYLSFAPQAEDMAAPSVRRFSSRASGRIGIRIIIHRQTCKACIHAPRVPRTTTDHQ